MRTHALTAAALAALALTAAGCGSSSDNKTTSAAKTATTAGGATATAGVKTTPEGAVVATAKITKPTVKAEPTPSKLIIKDLHVGTGPAAKPGDALTVQYVGALAKNGKVFDASWDRGGQPFALQLGAGQVIAGWDKGLVGMRVGGRRELIIPADLGYGPQGSPPSIPPNAALVFIVDLISIG